MILDGWGMTQNPAVSAPFQAKTPFIDRIWEEYPHATLRTDGEFVGLPDGQMGNSEVGHMNLGAGRVVYQNLVMINKALREDTLGKEKTLVDAFAYAKEKGKNIHILGLVSDGGIHSHINHLKGLLKVAKEQKAENVFVHAFTDGRDCDPKSGAGFIADIQEYMTQTTGKLASVVGRYFAMDRDNRWERVKKAYDVVVNAVGMPTQNAVNSLKESYAQGVTDEFIEPMVVVDEKGNPLAKIAPDDVVIFFNYRTDRGRELTQVLSQQDFPEQGMKKLPLYYVTMTNYDKNFENIHIVYNNDNLVNTLGEVLSKAGKKQIRIAETEKYPHVTFFFSGGREEPFEGESRLLCPSPKVATYDLKPEMSAYDIRNAIIPELQKQQADFVCLNFANGDMVGHTGVLEAAMKACEAVDACAQAVIETGLENGYSTLVIADHGNCEVMANEDGSPNTAHTTNPVPFILVDKDKITVKDGILGDIAPTILKMIGVAQPKEMTQHPLV